MNTKKYKLTEWPDDTSVVSVCVFLFLFFFFLSYVNMRRFYLQRPRTTAPDTWQIIQAVTVQMDTLISRISLHIENKATSIDYQRSLTVQLLRRVSFFLSLLRTRALTSLTNAKCFMNSFYFHAERELTNQRSFYLSLSFFSSLWIRFVWIY